jgi:hypothetical protein
MGVIIPLPLRARAANAALRFETIGGEVHHAQMLTFPQAQARDIRDVWGMTVEGPPRIVPDALAFSDGRPRTKPSRAKTSRAKSSSAKSSSAKRKPAHRSPK